MQPRLALDGENPRPLDEWQAVPAMWNEVRHAVDAARHWGAGRIRGIVMRAMSLFVCGVAAEHLTLQAIADKYQVATAGTDASVAGYASWIVASG